MAVSKHFICGGTYVSPSTEVLSLTLKWEVMDASVRGAASEGWNIDDDNDEFVW